MGEITAFNKNIFKSSKFLYSRIRRFLKSFDAANLIDEGEFPTYIKDVMDSLGMGVYRECQAILRIDDKRGNLPYNFFYTYSAYRVHDHKFSPHETIQDQQTFKYVTNVTKSYILESKACEIDCCNSSKQLLEKIEVKNYTIEGVKQSPLSFDRITPLRIIPHHGNRHHCEGHINPYHFHCVADHEVSFDYENKVLHTNFDRGYVYLKYYGLPIDEDGNLEIPDIIQIEKAMEWYIIYQLLLSAWFNNSVPDIQNKWQKAEQEYRMAFQEASYYLKLPSFEQMINTIRTTRSENKLVYMTNQYSNSNFQHS